MGYLSVSMVVSVEAFVGKHRVYINGLVNGHVAEIMLGFDHLKERGAIWNFKEDQSNLTGSCISYVAETVQSGAEESRFNPILKCHPSVKQFCQRR